MILVQHLIRRIRAGAGEMFGRQTGLVDRILDRVCIRFTYELRDIAPQTRALLQELPDFASLGA